MRLRRTVRAAGVLCTLAFFITSCSSPPGNPSVVPAARLSPDKKLASAYFIITVPQKAPSSLRAHYVSPATKSISMVVSTLSGKTVLIKNADLTPKSPGCTKISLGTRCTINGISLTAGPYRADVTGYSRTKEQGTVLSIVQSVPFTLKGSTPHKIAFTMDGVPTSFRVVPSSSAVTGSPAEGFTIGAAGLWGDPQTFLLSPLDADGDAIIGGGSPRLSVTSSNTAFTVFPPVGSQQSFVIIPPQNIRSASTQLTLSASYSNEAVCSQAGAQCVQVINLTYAPFAADDWITFAHDFQRTGSEKQSTGISAATVATLVQRWRVNFSDGVYSSPIVYNGNVIVASYGGVVYDLSAVDGSVIWETNISAAEYENTRSSPMIDTADGLVFMGTWYAMNGEPSAPRPSHFFALRLSDGSVAWKAELPGLIHDPPVYQNGVVYEGWSGGDPPGCINGGVEALNARTGTVEWTWLVNPVNNPGGGGSVWGALAWDGSHLVFGTGNTCQGEAWDQGAVALNPDGSMAWHYQADPTFADDNDTGSGVCVVNNTATFLNKNGTVYTLDTATGRALLAFPIGGLEGHATPTSDGSTFVVGTGLFPAPSGARKSLPHAATTGRQAYLKAMTPNGTILWSISANHAAVAYAALNDGVVYEGVDETLDAVSVGSGAVLARFPGASYFTAGPVIVPSGLYFADHSGYVYAYSLPRTAGANNWHKR